VASLQANPRRVVGVAVVEGPFVSLALSPPFLSVPVTLFLCGSLDDF
jgi:hypothetical protein